MKDESKSKIIDSFKNMKQAVEDPENKTLSEKVFGLNIMWKWIQDGSIKHELFDEALEALIEVL